MEFHREKIAAFKPYPVSLFVWAHYRSLQIKGGNRDAVIVAAESLVRAHNGRLFIGPEINGWIGLYLDGSLPAETFASKIGEQLKASVLDLAVHDGDVFIYNFYRDGRLIDEYSSCPDYFEEVPLVEHQRLKGKPEVFRDLLSSETDLQSLLTAIAAFAHHLPTTETRSQTGSKSGIIDY